MKTIGHLIVATVLSLPIAAARRVGAAVGTESSLVKLNEIKPENAKDGINKMIQTGFLKAIDQGRGLKNKDSRHHTRHGGRSPPVDTTRHQLDDDFFMWDDDQAMSEHGHSSHSGGVSKGGKSGHKLPKRSKSSKKGKSGKKGKKGGSEDAGYDGELMYTIEAFMDTRGLAPPIYPDANEPDDFGTGNINVYTDTMLWELDAIGASALIGLVQGTCTRTDPNEPSSPDYEGRGWCTLTFEALIGTELGQEVVASFTATGSVLNHNNTNFESSVLSITGGLGQFAGISGEIYLDTATLDLDQSPAKASYDPSIDFLNSPDGYIMFGFLYSDVRIDMLEPTDDAPVVDDAVFGDIFVDDAYDDDFGAYIDDDYTDDYATFFPSETSSPTNSQSTEEVVFCPGEAQEDFCDCAIDCLNFPDSRCACADAQTCCELSGFV